MGIMVRENDDITYYLKGADAVMQNKISSNDAHFMAEACLDLANEGLRTLVIAQRTISQECRKFLT
jgi:phospholipid-translocating ATPase